MSHTSYSSCSNSYEGGFNFKKVAHAPQLKANLEIGAFVQCEHQLMRNMKDVKYYRVIDVASSIEDMPHRERLDVTTKGSNATCMKLQMCLEMSRADEIKCSILQSTVDRMIEACQTSEHAWTSCVCDVTNTCFVFKEECVKNKLCNYLGSKTCYVIRCEPHHNKLKERDSAECLPFPCDYEGFKNI